MWGWTHRVILIIIINSREIAAVIYSVPQWHHLCNFLGKNPRRYKELASDQSTFERPSEDRRKGEAQEEGGRRKRQRELGYHKEGVFCRSTLCSHQNRHTTLYSLLECYTDVYMCRSRRSKLTLDNFVYERTRKVAKTSCSCINFSLK